MRYLILALGLTACAARWTAVDQASVTDAARANLAGYTHADAGPGMCRVFERNAYCASAAVLRRHDAGIPTGEIECQP